MGDFEGFRDILAGAFEEEACGVADFPGGLFVKWEGAGAADVRRSEEFVEHGVAGLGVVYCCEAGDKGTAASGFGVRPPQWVCPGVGDMGERAIMAWPAVWRAGRGPL